MKTVPILKDVKSLASTKFLSLFETIYQTNDNKELHYMVASRNKDYHPDKPTVNAVTLFVLNKSKDKMLITNEFRYPVNRYTTSTPAGLIDEGETPIESAIRELKEETGYVKVLEGLALPPTYSSVGMTDELVQPILLIIDETKQVATDLGDGELITHFWVTKEEAKEFAFNAEIGLTARAQLALLLFATGGFDQLNTSSKLVGKSKKAYTVIYTTSDEMPLDRNKPIKKPRYEIGETCMFDGQPTFDRYSNNGFYAYETIDKLLTKGTSYYNFPRICEAELTGTIIEENGIYLTNEMTILKEIDYDQFKHHPVYKPLWVAYSKTITQKELKKLVKSKDSIIREAVVRRNQKDLMDKLINDLCYDVREAIAEMGHKEHINVLIHDKEPMVVWRACSRIDVNDFDDLMDSDNLEILVEIANRGLKRHLDILVHHENSEVREAVGKRSFKDHLDILVNDKDFYVVKDLIWYFRDEHLKIIEQRYSHDESIQRRIMERRKELKNKNK